MKTLTKLKAANARLYPKHLYYSPDWVVLGVNNICNLHCKMCDVGVDFNESNFFQNLVGSKPLNMPLELIKRVIDQTANNYPSAKLGYAFTEPLIYPHLVESLAYANERGLFTSITTNALTLKHKAPDMLAAGLNEINISLDGPEEIHNYIRGHKSSFQRAIAGIEALLAGDHPPSISVYCVITEWNIGHLKAFADYFADFPLLRLGFMHTNFTSDDMAAVHNERYGLHYPATASNMEEINIDQMDMDLLWEEISAIRATNYPFEVVFSPEVNSRAALQQFYFEPSKLMGKRCHDIFHNIMIKSNGDVIPAHGRCYNLTIGNLHEQSLEHIWNSAEISRFRREVTKAGGLLPACSRCCSGFGQ